MHGEAAAFGFQSVPLGEKKLKLSRCSVGGNSRGSNHFVVKCVDELRTETRRPEQQSDDLCTRDGEKWTTILIMCCSGTEFGDSW